MEDVMNVEIWSDVACPWCCIGKRNLEGVAVFEHGGEVRRGMAGA